MLIIFLDFRDFSLSEASTRSGFIPAFKHLRQRSISFSFQNHKSLLIKPAPLTTLPATPVYTTVPSSRHAAVGLAKPSPEERPAEEHEDVSGDGADIPAGVASNCSIVKVRS